MPYESINPYDGKLLESFKEHTDKELEAAVSTAATCFTKWRHKSFAERAAVTAKAAALMRASVDEFSGQLARGARYAPYAPQALSSNDTRQDRATAPITEEPHLA